MNDDRISRQPVPRTPVPAPYEFHDSPFHLYPHLLPWMSPSDQQISDLSMEVVLSLVPDLAQSGRKPSIAARHASDGHDEVTRA